MSIHLFKSVSKLVTGIGASEELIHHIHRLKMSKILVLTDKGVLNSEAVEKIKQNLINNNVEYTIYSDITPEPEIDVVLKTKQFFKRDQYNGIVAIGGGSVIDTAKCVAIYGNNNVPLDSLFGENKVEQKGLPLIVLPTTAGTGSEVTNIAILSDTVNQVKKGIVSDYLLPDVAIIAPEMTVSCPPSITAASGVDALVHAIESFISVNASPLTDAFAIQAMTLIMKSLPAAYANPENMRAREDLANASLMAGLAFGNAGVGAVHALAYPLGGRFHIAHGVSNALLLPYVMEYNKVACLDKFRIIAQCFDEPIVGCNSIQIASKVIDRLYLLCEMVNIPKGLNHFNIPKEVIPELAAEAIKIERLLRNNPRKLNLQEIEKIYEAAY
ncbi:iron-containing alcohol dehydrogenase [Acinetobacter higginsii]|uniref:iron-containing alcohol dehydrogenase n=1 Tax=Acinetobacter higginsii TaxID=70347 RepID=UPI001F4A906D|nr:iron-containing alcohol dehydrogenase [Acinetobacter higginsii]MCH7295558.1 iron-containing alcohol dehydrogenase [Acinetobacter higginsii]